MAEGFEKSTTFENVPLNLEEPKPEINVENNAIVLIVIINKSNKIKDNNFNKIT